MGFRLGGISARPGSCGSPGYKEGGGPTGDSESPEATVTNGWKKDHR